MTTLSIGGLYCFCRSISGPVCLFRIVTMPTPSSSTPAGRVCVYGMWLALDQGSELGVSSVCFFSFFFLFFYWLLWYRACCLTAGMGNMIHAQLYNIRQPMIPVVMDTVDPGNAQVYAFTELRTHVSADHSKQPFIIHAEAGSGICHANKSISWQPREVETSTPLLWVSCIRIYPQPQQTRKQIESKQVQIKDESYRTLS